MRFILPASLCAAVLALMCPASAQQQDSEIVTVGADKFLRWYGHPGRTYFIEISDPNQHLNKWTWAPIIESGNDENISYEVDGTADKGFFRLWFSDLPTNDPDGSDFDNDDLFNWDEVSVHQTNPLRGDTDGDGMPDGWEISNELDPLFPEDAPLDYDGDGLSNLEEFENGTHIFQTDSDGDGTDDGVEVAEGTDPSDSADYAFQWRQVTRSLAYDFDDYPPPNNTGSLGKTAAWNTDLNTNESLAAAISFPDLSVRLGQIAFPASPPQAGGTIGLAPISGQSQVMPNPPCYHATMNHHRFWLHRPQAVAAPFQQRAMIVTERSVDATAQPLVFESTDVTIPANGTTSGHVDLAKGFTQNFSGNAAHTETFTSRLCPLELRQTNMPNLGVTPDNTTDLGGQRGTRMIGVGGTAYITGEPVVPQLRARFRDLPQTISVEWRLEVRTERPAERFTLDDRDFPGVNQWVTLAGNQEWDITAAMGSQFVGGDCTLHYRVNGGNPGNITFYLRGKNPLDDDARTIIDGSVGAAFQAYAWAMAKHESRQGTRAYNQFNTQATIEGTLNWGTPNGWGICQIDRPVGNPGVTTAEVWNWETNVTAMNAILVDKQATYNRFIGYFRDSYGQQQNWSEPPSAHTIGNTTLPAEAWGVMVLYNGADAGVPVSAPPSRPQGFRCPWVFDPADGSWTFHDNSQTYASGRVRPEIEEAINTIQ
jgi:Bacterial TSP3 repeat